MEGALLTKTTNGIVGYRYDRDVSMLSKNTPILTIQTALLTIQNAKKGVVARSH